MVVVPQWLCIAALVEECHCAELKIIEQSLASQPGSQAWSPASQTALSGPSFISALTTPPRNPILQTHHTAFMRVLHAHPSQPITEMNLHQVTSLPAGAIPVLLWPGTTTFKLSMADLAHCKRKTDLEGTHTILGQGSKDEVFNPSFTTRSTVEILRFGFEHLTPNRENRVHVVGGGIYVHQWCI